MTSGAVSKVPPIDVLINTTVALKDQLAKESESSSAKSPSGALPESEKDKASKRGSKTLTAEDGNEVQPIRDTLSDVINDENRIVFEKAYGFLSTCGFTHLRQIASRWKIVQTGATQNKIYLARIFLFLLEGVRDKERTVNDVLSVDYSWGYLQYLQEWTPAKESMNIPSLEELRKEARLKPKTKSLSKSTSKTTAKRRKATESPTSRKRKAATSPTSKASKRKKKKEQTAKANASELARLLLIFQLYSETRDRFSQTLGRRELDNGIKGKEFWDEYVSKVFNDPNFKPRVSFGPALKRVDPSKPPATMRDGRFLENMLRTFQPAWGEVEGGFRLSGQNSPDFEHYLSEVRKRDVLSGIGQMLLVCGEIVRIGSEFEDKDMLNLLSRKSCALGNEGGLQKKLPDYVMKTEEKSPSTAKGTKTRVSLEKASDAVVGLVNSIQKSFADTNSSQGNWDVSYETQQMEALSKAEIFANDPKLSEKLRKRWKTHYEKIEADLDKSTPTKANPA